MSTAYTLHIPNTPTIFSALTESAFGTSFLDMENVWYTYRLKQAEQYKMQVFYFDKRRGQRMVMVAKVAMYRNNNALRSIHGGIKVPENVLNIRISFKSRYELNYYARN